MASKFDTGFQPPRPPQARQAARVPIHAEVSLRRSGANTYSVRVFDVSPFGAKLEFVERPRLDEHVWVKFDGLNAIEASVCWIEGHAAGIRFARPIYAAVFDALVKRLG